MKIWAPRELRLDLGLGGGRELEKEECALFLLVCVICHEEFVFFSISAVVTSAIVYRERHFNSCIYIFNQYLQVHCIESFPMHTNSLWEVVDDHCRSKLHEKSLIIVHNPDLGSGPKLNQGPLD